MELINEEYLMDEVSYKQEVIDSINEIGKANSEYINIIKEYCKSLGLDEINVPAIGIYMSNKVFEMAHVFEKCGLSIYSQSYVSEAVLEHLRIKYLESAHVLNLYLDTLDEVKKAFRKPKIVLEYLLKLPLSLIFPDNPVQIVANDATKELLKRTEDYYKEICENIWNYNIENNIVESLVDIINDTKYETIKTEASDVPKLVEEQIIPDLKKLGLEHLIPNLKEEIIKSYVMSLPENIGEDEITNYIPSFSDDDKVEIKIIQFPTKSAK